MNLSNIHDALTRAVDWMTDTPPDRRRAKRFDVPADLVRRRQRGA